MDTLRQPSRLPEGVNKLFLFDVFNITSFTLVMGTPMLLYFKKLGASATVLSLVAALAFLMNILQIPAANFVERIGYRTFVLRGWTTRTFFVLLMAAVAFIPQWIDNTTRICFMLFLLFCYNTSRGISVCGFMPWITQLIPEKMRGKFVSLDQIYITITTVVITALVAIYFYFFKNPSHFTPIFFLSFLSALVSLTFLRQVPDAPVPEIVKNREPVPWLAIFNHPPFKRLLAYNFIVNSAVSVGAVFYITFLRDVHQASDSMILILNVIAGSVSVLSLFYFGKMLDRVGNLPFLFLGNFLLFAHFGIWCAIAARLIPLNLWTLGLLQLTTGFGSSFFNMANVRLSMGVVPEMGRSHFFALLSVCNSLTLGLVPIFWGLVIDILQPWHAQIGPWHWNAYSLLYSILALTMVGAFLALYDIQDKQSITTRAFVKELFVVSPYNAISRLRNWIRIDSNKS